MPSSLPTDPAGSKAVDTFGLGTYDSLRDDESHGEDDESREPEGMSIPDGGPSDGFDFEFLIGYPQETVTGPKHATGSLPGDSDRPPTSPRPADDTLDALAGPPSDVRMSQSGLPDDADNPAARSDYYDEMSTGNGRIWPSEDSGAYVTQELKKTGPGVPQPYVNEEGQFVDDKGEVEALPTPEFNDVSMDDFLGALGNSWSGYVVEDQAVPTGFPTDDFTEEADFMDENPILPEVWQLQPFGYTTSGDAMAQGSSPRTATNIELVGTLTDGFLKAYGKKNLVRRQILAFLQEKGHPQFLASDVVRCLKHRHDIVIPDVMDVFPVSKSASAAVRKLSSAHDRIVEAMIEHAHDAPVASVLRKCAANLARVMAEVERLDSDG